MTSTKSVSLPTLKCSHFLDLSVLLDTREMDEPLQAQELYHPTEEWKCTVPHCQRARIIADFGGSDRIALPTSARPFNIEAWTGIIGRDVYCDRGQFRTATQDRARIKILTGTPQVHLNLPRRQIPFSSVRQDGDNFLIRSKLFGDLNRGYDVGARAHAHQQSFFPR
jgi:hypothetical protein